jgi:hypothetical protein
MWAAALQVLLHFLTFKRTGRRHVQQWLPEVHINRFLRNSHQPNALRIQANACNHLVPCNELQRHGFLG